MTAASTFLSAAALFGYQIHQAGREAERTRVLAMAEVYAAQVAGVIAPPGEPPSPSELQTLVEGWAWHPGSRLLAVLNHDGGDVVVRGDRELLNRWMTAGGFGLFYRGELADSQSGPLPAGSHISDLKSHISIIPGDRQLHLPGVSMAVVPIVPAGSDRALGALAYATRTSQASEAGLSARVWKYLGVVLAISGVGFLMGLGLLRHSLLDPLGTLLQLGRDRHRLASVPAERSDEIGALARLLADMNDGLDQWRSRVAHLEASVDRRVRDETWKVTLRLRQVEQKAWIDPLTKLANRRLLDEKLPRLFSEQREAKEDLAVVMIDVDHFKNLNDTLGHKAGDELISFAGELLRQCIRGEDFAVRYGGDEFLLILPGATSTQAGMAAERIIRLFGQRAALLAVSPKPSMSAGVASLRDHQPATATALLQMADRALYRAKSLGKSRVSVYRPVNIRVPLA